MRPSAMSAPKPAGEPGRRSGFMQTSRARGSLMVDEAAYPPAPAIWPSSNVIVPPAATRPVSCPKAGTPSELPRHAEEVADVVILVGRLARQGMSRLQIDEQPIVDLGPHPGAGGGKRAPAVLPAALPDGTDIVERIKLIRLQEVDLPRRRELELDHRRQAVVPRHLGWIDRKSTRLNSSP